MTRATSSNPGAAAGSEELPGGAVEDFLTMLNSGAVQTGPRQARVQPRRVSQPAAAGGIDTTTVVQVLGIGPADLLDRREVACRGVLHARGYRDVHVQACSGTVLTLRCGSSEAALLRADADAVLEQINDALRADGDTGYQRVSITVVRGDGRRPGTRTQS